MTTVELDTAERRVVSHMVAALKAALHRISGLEELILSGDEMLLRAERAAITEIRRGPEEAA